ncbi:MAG: DUF1177 domain-containing protein [Bacillota bacterium]
MLKQVMEIWELLDDPGVDGAAVAAFFTAAGLPPIALTRVKGEVGKTDFISFVIPGRSGRTHDGSRPTLGVVGQLGGIGARPARLGLVSDADGALVALAVALKLTVMGRRGDVLEGDVIVTTHICPDAPTVPHDPVPFMGSPVDMGTSLKHLVSPAMDAVLSVDTTRGNRLLNHRGFAITPTVKEGYILRVAEDLLTLMAETTGRPPVVLPVTTQDLTPYGNGVHHINSILQPATVTAAPVVGLALTAESTVPGSASGASQPVDIEQAARFTIEVAKGFTAGTVRFHDPVEYDHLVALYGRLDRLQRKGDPSHG